MNPHECRYCHSIISPFTLRDGERSEVHMRNHLKRCSVATKKERDYFKANRHWPKNKK